MSDKRDTFIIGLIVYSLFISIMFCISAENSLQSSDSYLLRKCMESKNNVSECLKHFPRGSE